MPDLQWRFKTHAAIFTGTEQYALKLGWDSIFDEFAHKTLLRKRGIPVPYKGIVLRANRPLVTRAVRLEMPVLGKLKGTCIAPRSSQEGEAM